MQGNFLVAGAFAGLILISAVWVVTLRNLFRAALSLGLVLLGVAGLFLVLEAEFLAFVQILVYVGAVLTLVVFAIMLTAKLHGSPVAQPSRNTLAASLVCLLLFALLTLATRTLPWPTTPRGEAASLPALGQQLVTTLVLPFEVVSFAFVAVLVGAIALVTSDRAR